MNSEINENWMIPYLGKISHVKDLGEEIKLIGVKLINGGEKAFRDYRPGQFAFLSAFGIGEAPFGIASTVERGSTLEFAIQRLGTVTTALHQLGEGDMIGVRGPMGNSFPMDHFKGKNLVVIGGGIGGAPLRPIIHSVLDNRGDYGQFSILWAARHPSLLIFTEEYEYWRAAPDTELHLTVDQADKLWGQNVGLITDLLEKVAPSAENTIAIACGPPIMIHFTELMLAKLGFQPEQCYVTLEARMHCGLGKCGRCNLGEKLICVDGPVFSMDEVGQLLESFM
jgi:sulfhydrogenase subunit gamma (sulfur reductase)